MINHGDYQAGFDSVIDGIPSCKVDDRVLVACYNRTVTFMSKPILDKTFDLLAQKCNRHPTYKDFIESAYEAGFKFPDKKKNSGASYEVGTCGLKTCDGSGYLTVLYVSGYTQLEQQKIYRCPCNLGRNKPDNIPVWNDAMTTLGYSIKDDWRELAGKVPVDYSKTVEKQIELEERMKLI